MIVVIVFHLVKLGKKEIDCMWKDESLTIIYKNYRLLVPALLFCRGSYQMLWKTSRYFLCNPR